MHHKRNRAIPLLLALVITTVLVVGALILTDVPAPAKPVEKELDAKTFLGAAQ